jgi:hypothetical protein
LIIGYQDADLLFTHDVLLSGLAVLLKGKSQGDCEATRFPRSRFNLAAECGGSLAHALEPMMSTCPIAYFFRECVRMCCVRAHPIVAYL